MDSLALGENKRLSTNLISLDEQRKGISKN
jgi:hypothetical protein